MFALFFSLYYSLFTGTWHMFPLDDIATICKQGLNGLGTFLTSIFGDNQMTNIGDSLLGQSGGYYNYISIASIVLALITSIGIVVMAVKGIKRVFGVFFMGIRR